MDYWHSRRALISCRSFSAYKSDGLHAAAARRVSEVDEVHAVDLQLQSAAMRARWRLLLLLLLLSGKMSKKASLSLTNPRRRQRRTCSPVDAASGRLLIGVPAANKADAADMFVSDNGSIHLIRLVSGEDLSP
eukprot:gene31766-41230_t